MKKKDIMNLIRCHVEGDEEGFEHQAFLIANEFDNSGDSDLANYIYSLLSTTNTITPQENGSMKHIGVMELIKIRNKPLYLPNILKDNLIGVVNAVKKNIGMNTFLFYGHPGTGKTEAAVQVARLLKRQLWKVNISQLVDSKLGETSKNISKLFSDIKDFPFKKNMVVLFDEIDSLALNRNDSRDLREMARAITELFVGLDNLPEDVVIIATTNMYKQIDSALLRRFVAKINFDVYTKDDLCEIGLKILHDYSNRIEGIELNTRILTKMFLGCEKLPYPGDLKNIIRSSIAFSNPDNPNDYLKKLLMELCPNIDLTDYDNLHNVFGFSSRDISLITGESKSGVGRRLKHDE